MHKTARNISRTTARKTALATALMIVALGGAATAVNAAGSQSGHASTAGDVRREARASVPAIYAVPPWIRQHIRFRSANAG
jgi:hypothetical protein